MGIVENIRTKKYAEKLAKKWKEDLPVQKGKIIFDIYLPSAMYAEMQDEKGIEWTSEHVAIWDPDEAKFVDDWKYFQNLKYVIQWEKEFPYTPMKWVYDVVDTERIIAFSAETESFVHNWQFAAEFIPFRRPDMFALFLRPGKEEKKRQYREYVHKYIYDVYIASLPEATYTYLLYRIAEAKEEGYELPWEEAVHKLYAQKEVGRRTVVKLLSDLLPEREKEQLFAAYDRQFTEAVAQAAERKEEVYATVERMEENDKKIRETLLKYGLDPDGKITLADVFRFAAATLREGEGDKKKEE